MRLIITTLLILFTLASTGQIYKRDTTWIPFRIKLVDKKDTLATGFQFYLTQGQKTYTPSRNDSLKCFQFTNVDSIDNFELIYKNKKHCFKNIETVRLMYDSEWIITLDTLATDTCYEIIAAQVGCFSRVYLAPYPTAHCSNKNYIWLTSFLPYTYISGSETGRWKNGKVAYKLTFGENNDIIKEFYWDKSGNAMDRKSFEKIWKRKRKGLFH